MKIPAVPPTLNNVVYTPTIMNPEVPEFHPQQASSITPEPSDENNDESMSPDATSQVSFCYYILKKIV